MKKIGIMSMQRIYNYGSFLQAYGLKKTIESIEDCKVEFVDYHVESPIIDSNKGGKLSKVLDLISQPGKISHKIKYAKYKRNFKNNFKELNIIDEHNYNPTLDTLVIGSDEVFNCVQSNRNVGYSLELFGKNNNAERLISYAASFGNTTIDKLKKYHKEEEIAECLNKFNSISVRDLNSNRIVKSLIGTECNINIDPVLLYGYDELINSFVDRPIKEKYLVLYAYSGRISKVEAKKIKEYAKTNNLKIVAIGGVQPYANYFIDCTPFEVFKYFKYAECVVTDTFHGSIFSILCQKNFITMVRKSEGKAYGNEEKLSYLLTLLSLQKQMSYTFDYSLLEKTINYDETNKILKEEREKSIEYLKKSL